MFLCSSTRSKLIPRIIVPKDESHPHSWISIEKYRTYVIPILVDLYSYHVTCIRETLLEYFNSYWQLIDRTTLTDVILPQVHSFQKILDRLVVFSFCLAYLWTEGSE